MLVATDFRVALGVVREPVLVGVHPDEVLEADGDSCLLMSLELRQTEESIGLDDGSGQQIFVTPSGVMTIDLAEIVICAVVVACAGVTDKLAGIAEIED